MLDKPYARRSGVNVENDVAMLLAQKKESGVRPMYLRELGYGLGQFCIEYGDYDIATIEDEHLRSWLSTRKVAASTKETLQRRLSALFSWAVRRQYITSNPVERLESVRGEKDDPEIFSNDQCKALVDAARQLDPGMLVLLTLALFMGLRPEECRRLDPEAINLGQRTITVSSRAAKTRNRRIVTMTEPAYRILVNYGQNEYKVNWRKRFDVVRMKAGIERWPKDVLRHTAASHFFNIYGLNKATEQLGHSADVML